MSPFDIIPLIIIVISLVGIIFIVVRKFPVLTAIDVKSIKSEQEAEKKEEIIASRLKRKIGGVGKTLNIFLTPITVKLKRGFKDFYSKVLGWEKKYAAKKPKILKTPDEAEKKIKTLFFAVDEYLKEDKLSEAEKGCIEIIGLDHKNIEAYKKLGLIYLEQKNDKHAEETFLHILKLKPEDVETLIDLGLFYKNKGENDKALDVFQRAVDFEPTNPKNLDFLIEMSIIVGNKGLAQEMFKRLREVNPENQKLDEFALKIKTMD